MSKYVDIEIGVGDKVSVLRQVWQWNDEFASDREGLMMILKEVGEQLGLDDPVYFTTVRGWTKGNEAVRKGYRIKLSLVRDKSLDEIGDDPPIITPQEAKGLK